MKVFALAGLSAYAERRLWLRRIANICVATLIMHSLLILLWLFLNTVDLAHPLKHWFLVCSVGGCSFEKVDGDPPSESVKNIFVLASLHGK